MTQEELLERIRKRQEELEKENQVVTFETNEETGETTPSIDFDKMPKQEQLALRVKAIENGYVNEEYKLATEQADRAEKSLLEGASRERLADFYKVYTDETNRAIQNGDTISYYKNEIMRSKIKNMLADQSSPLSALQDTISEVETGVMGSIADTINLGAMGYITLTDNIDADALYNVAKNTNGNLQDTLDKYSTGKKNYERLEKLKQAYPNDKIVDSVYKHVTDQNFKGDKKYFYDTVGYLNNLLNTSRFERFERAHTLDETEARENLKLRESMSYGKLGQFALDTVGTISYMAPSIALGMGVNSAVGSGVTAGGKQILSKEAGREIAKQVGLTTMATSAAGQAANSTLRQGYEWNQALAKGVSDGMLEYLSELIGGEVLNKALVGSRSAVTPLGKLIGKGVEKIENKWLKFGASVLGDITAEAWEEMATEAIQPFLDRAILNKDITDWEQYGKDIINAGIQSILPTLILGGMNRVQVSNTIKKQMEAIAFAIETTPSSYLSEEQKNQLRQGVKEAYENATHFLSDEQTEEQYNQVVEDTYKALQEAEKKYKSAQELAKLINAGTNLERAQQRPQIFDENLQGVRQTQEAEEMVSRLNTAQQSINNSIEEQNLTHNLNQALSQNAFGKTTSEQNITVNDNVLNQAREIVNRHVEMNDSYNNAINSIKMVLENENGIDNDMPFGGYPNEEAYEAKAREIYEQIIDEMQSNDSNLPSQRMTNSTYSNAQINTFKDIIKASPYGSIGEFTSDIASELAKIDGEMASNVEPYWNEAKRIVEAITNDDLSKIKKPRKSLRKNSADKIEQQVEQSTPKTAEIQIPETKRKFLKDFTTMELRENQNQGTSRKPSPVPENVKRVLNGLENDAGNNLSFKEQDLWDRVSQEMEGKSNQELVEMAKQYGLELTEEDFEDGDGYVDLSNAIEEQVTDELKKQGYERFENVYFAEKPIRQGYEDLIDWLDENDIDYEISRSSQGGLVPSIYIKNADGDTVMRIANHHNHSTNDYNSDSTYTYKDYTQWRDKILPDIQDRLGLPIDQKFGTDMEKSRNSIIERKIKAIEANPSLREEHETTSLTEIRNFINQQLLKGRLGTGQFRHKAYGVYNRLSNWVRLRQGSNVDTLIHELGHYIDDEILKSMYKNNPDMKKELGKLCEMAFPGSYRGKTRLMEGFAEATRYFIIAPEELAKLAPVTAAVITNEFDKSETLKDVYPELQRMFHDYINMTPQERVHSKVVTGTPKDRPSIGGKVQNALRWIVRQVFNKNEAATFYDKTIEKAWQEKYGKGMPVPTALKLFDNLRRANSSGDSIKQLLTNGVYDPMDGKRVTNGVNRILEPFREEAETKAKELGLTKDQYLNRRINDMIDLGLAERTIELYERSEREGKTYETGIRLEDAKAIKKQFTKDKAVHQVLKDIRKVSNDIIDYAVKKGVLKEESASEIKASNVFYMPLNRIMDEFGSFGASTSDGATRTPFHRLNGSDRDIQNPMESLVGNWARVLKTIDDNFVRQQMVKVGKQVEDFGDFFTEVAPLSKYQGTVSLEVFKKFLEDRLSPSEFSNLNLEEAYNLFVPELASKEKMTLSYLENGKRKYIKFANNDYGRPLYEMLTMLNANQVNQVLNAISWFNQGIRLGATSMNPFFALGNTISDEFQAFLYSDGLVIPVAQAIFDIARLWKAKRVLNREDISTSDRELKELYSRYKTSNASLAGKFKLAEKNVKEVAPDIWGVSNKALFGSESKLNKAKDIMSKFGGMISAIPEFSEEMTRFGEFVRVYKQLVREGMSKPQAQLEAGIKAREITQDFSIQGEFMQHLNKIIPFSAAKVGGLYRFGQEFKKHPGRLSMRMGMLIGFAMLIAQLRHGDDDAEEYYEELNNRKKFDNFVFDNPTDGAHPFVIKKPQGVPRYFLGLTEYIFDLATGYIPKGEEEKRFKDWLALSTSDLLPISSPTDMVPGFAQSLLENILNQDFYYGSKIVPTNLEKLDPENQYNEYTSEIGKALGKIFNYSPIKIDNIIEGAFAGMGSFALDTGDYIYDLATGNDTRVRGQDYVKSRLFGDVFRSSESVNMVYEKLEKYENDEAEGRLTEEEAEEYERLKVAKTIFNKISKQMKEIRTDDTMKSDKKEEELNKLYELRTDTARYYLGKELISDNSQSKIEIYRYYPASTTYKYKVGNKTVELSFEDNSIQEEYANMLKTQYERELTKLKRKSEYRRADPAGQAELEKNLLSNTRQKVNETMKERVYRRQRK